MTRAASGTLALLAAALVATSCAAVPAGSDYVALGSSFAAGPGLEPVADDACFRSGANYPHLVAEARGLALVDVTCTGSSTEDMPVQTESITAETRLVTLTLGGNDVGYATALDGWGCLDIGLCEDDPVDPAEVESGLATLADRLSAVVEDIRSRAPQARVLLVGYPRILPPDGVTCTDLPLTAEHTAFARSVGERLDDAFRQVAGRTGTTLVDVWSASSERGVCEPSDPWVAGLPPGTAPSGNFPFHPTAEGMRAVADLVGAAL